jgi:putative transposase
MAEHERATQQVAPTGPVLGSVAAIMGQFKSAVTKRINQMRGNPGCPVWQRNYYERVIRNDRELAAIREYIMNNPVKWPMDNENSANNKRV